ncbi:TPA: hypothetical protein HA338_11155 [Methanosarcina acetivorans]|nr:hypothetical protein [Methanosarcina acetivorans]
MVHCLNCGLVYTASGLKTPDKISVRVYVNRIERPFTRWVKLNAGELLHKDEEIVLDSGRNSDGNQYIITSLQVGVRRVPSALAEELDTIWARPLDEIAFAKRRKGRQKHPAALENMIGVPTPSEAFDIVQET